MDVSIAIPDGLTLQTDVAPTEWVDENLLPLRGGGDGARVGEIVPTGFEAYTRILHPASRRVGDHRYEPITWSELARTRGKTIHPEVQLKALLGDEFRQPPPWGELPEEDSIPEGLRAPLADILRRFTDTPDRCWFCIWEGYGIWFGGKELRAYSDMSKSATRARREANRQARREAAALEEIPKASIMGGMRRCLVFTGSIDAVPDMTIGGWSHTPNWWWPDDRAWIVVSELDTPSTYVGGSATLVEAILGEPRLETVRSDPAHRFDWMGDRINAPE